MNRKITNQLRYIMDEWLPPVIRDSRLFMYPVFRYWFKNKKIGLYMDFKSIAGKLTEDEYSEVYRSLNCRATDRTTDLNDNSISWILKSINPLSNTVLDAGSGRGFLLERLKKNSGKKIFGCDLLEHCPVEGVVYKTCGIENLDFENRSIDTVISTHTIEHLRNPSKAINELKRVAAKQLIVVVPKQRYYYYSLDLHLNFYPYREAIIDAIGLKNFECYEIDGDWVYSGLIE